MTDTTQSGRPLPALTDLNRTYWTSGAAGVWRLQRCPACERLIHPPALRCQYDHAVPEWVDMSGRGTVESWTVNHHPFYPGIPTPYVIAFVNPVEDRQVRVLTNLVDVDPACRSVSRSRSAPTTRTMTSTCRCSVRNRDDATADR